MSQSPTIRRNAFRADLRELRFALWEQLGLAQRIGGFERYSEFSRDVVDELLVFAHRFAYKHLGPIYREADVEGCALDGHGGVRVPLAYEALWRGFVDQGWGSLGAPREHGGLGAPYVVCQAINEMFMGAEPSFMTYSGFCPATISLIERYGSDDLRRNFCPKLAALDWTACLCMTEADAGSDLTLLRTRATPVGDGSYRIQGEKLFVSAAGHHLTDNIVYVVLARGQGAPSGVFGLSVFLVPQRWPVESDGRGADNQVRCVRLEDKMGLHGSSTAAVTFGAATRGLLLGKAENQGLLQLRSMMAQARIATGIYALGMASSAYLNAVAYAQGRVQGRRASRALDPRAEQVPIIEHADVRRMLLEMKSRVEGCRALIMRLSWYQTAIEGYAGATPGDDAERAVLRRCQRLAALLTPLAKAYVSDQAWKVCELAIQVHGGAGYTGEYPVEQYARDVKVLSIWEGTNFIQAVDLVHRQLAVGRRSPAFEALLEELRPALSQAAERPALRREAEQVQSAVAAVSRGLERLGVRARQREVEEIHGYATRLLEALAETVLGWLLLEAAEIAASRLADGLDDPVDRHFYAGKVATARYFVWNVLPGVQTKVDIIETGAGTAASVPPDIFRSG